MSSTPYRVQDLVGASPFTGTAPQSILAAPFDDIPDDAEPGDRFYFETNVSVQKTSGTAYTVRQKLLLDGVNSHEEVIASIGIAADARFLICRYNLTIIDASTCWITADVTLSGTGGFGPNPQYRSNPATPLPAFDVGNPVPIDFTVELTSASATCTPQLIDGWKVLNLGGSVGASDILTVNGKGPDVTGEITLTFNDVGALDVAYKSMPDVFFDDVNGYYDPRPPEIPSDYPCRYNGLQNPTDAPNIHPEFPFIANVDRWIQET